MKVAKRYSFYNKSIGFSHSTFLYQVSVMSLMLMQWQQFADSNFLFREKIVIVIVIFTKLVFIKLLKHLECFFFFSIKVSGFGFFLGCKTSSFALFSTLFFDLYTLLLSTKFNTTKILSSIQTLTFFNIANVMMLASLWQLDIFNTFV